MCNLAHFLVKQVLGRSIRWHQVIKRGTEIDAFKILF